MITAANAAHAQPFSGNRANGMNYQPTPSEVVPREQAAGVRPPRADRQRTDNELGTLNRSLLRSEGLNPADAPDLAPRP